MTPSESIRLNNSVMIPANGFGTWLIGNDKAWDAVNTDLECGYRHIDTAQAYENEDGVGRPARPL